MSAAPAAGFEVSRVSAGESAGSRDRQTRGRCPAPSSISIVLEQLAAIETNNRQSRRCAGRAPVRCAARGTPRRRCARRSANRDARRPTASPPAPRPQRPRRVADCEPRSAHTASTHSNPRRTDPRAHRRPRNASTPSRESARPRHEAYERARTTTARHVIAPPTLHRSPPALRSRQLARSPTPSCAALGPVKAAPSRTPAKPSPVDATWRTGRLAPACLGRLPAPASPRPADLRDAVACRGAPVKAPQARCDSNGLCRAAEGGSGIA